MRQREWELLLKTVANMDELYDMIQIAERDPIAQSWFASLSKSKKSLTSTAEVIRQNLEALVRMSKESRENV
jgi:hypothetical protein